MGRIRVEYDDKRLRRNIDDFSLNFRRAVMAVTDRRAAIATTWMRTNARWTDRTGAARSGLFATPIHAGSYEEILLAYSVNYSIWLETAHDRKYAIIQPAMIIMASEYMEDLRNLIDHMGMTP